MRLDRLIGLFRYRKDPLELLTLSACQTGTGDDRSALGLAGVAIKAGARVPSRHSGSSTMRPQPPWSPNSTGNYGIPNCQRHKHCSMHSRSSWQIESMNIRHTGRRFCC